jgi:hypothetical protein
MPVRAAPELDNGAAQMWSLVAFLIAGLTRSILPSPTVHVRPVGGFIDRVLREGAVRSVTMRRLLTRLEDDDVIVYVAAGSASGQRDPAHLQFVSGSAGQRYLRITINLLGNRRTMAVLLAHELHHAREVAAHPEVIDQKSMERLYEQLGWRRPGRTSAFETRGSSAVSARVLAEMSGEMSGRMSGMPPGHTKEGCP